MADLTHETGERAPTPGEGSVTPERKTYQGPFALVARAALALSAVGGAASLVACGGEEEPAVAINLPKESASRNIENYFKEVPAQQITLFNERNPQEKVRSGMAIASRVNKNLLIFNEGSLVIVEPKGYSPPKPGEMVMGFAFSGKSRALEITRIERGPANKFVGKSLLAGGAENMSAYKVLFKADKYPHGDYRFDLEGARFVLEIIQPNPADGPTTATSFIISR